MFPAPLVPQCQSDLRREEGSGRSLMVIVLAQRDKGTLAHLYSFKTNNNRVGGDAKHRTHRRCPEQLTLGESCSRVRVGFYHFGRT